MGFKLRLALLLRSAGFPHSGRRTSTVWAQSVPSARSNRDLLAPTGLPACCKKIVLQKSLRKYRERRRSEPRARGNRGHPLARRRTTCWRKTKRAARRLPQLKPSVRYRRTALRFLFFRGLFRRRSRLLRRRRGRVRRAGHSFFETADAFPEPPREFGNLAAPEQEQDNRQDDQPMNWTKLTHEQPPRDLPVRAPLHSSAGRFGRQA